MAAWVSRIPFPGKRFSKSGASIRLCLSTTAASPAPNDLSLTALGIWLPPYSLGADLEGFKSITYPNIVINIGRNTAIELTLDPASEDEAIIEEPAEN